MAQAMAHNASTVERDLDLFESVLAARARHGDHEAGAILTEVQHAHEHLRHAYAGLLGVFGQEVGSEAADPDGHVHDHDHGNERSLVATAHHDAGLARRYETR